ncbi:MAG TPA: SLC13 family permease [Bellilinea sp.]|nr:SLC13 family permease [Bellilinea sp.]
MSLDLWIVLGILGVTAFFLFTEKIKPDVMALLVLGALGLFGIVGPERLFTGFSSAAVITLIGISLIAAGLQQTGVTLTLSRWMHAAGKSGENAMILVTFLTSALLSVVMNNIAAVGILLPTVMALSRSAKIKASVLLMPLAFGTLIGGMATLFTTSNLIVSASLADTGYRPFNVVDFFPIGIPLIVIGALYMVTIGKKILEKTSDQLESGPSMQLAAKLHEMYGIGDIIHSVYIESGSPVVGQTISGSNFGARTGLNVIGIHRGGQTILAPRRIQMLYACDILLTQGVPNHEELENLKLNLLKDQLNTQIVDDSVKLGEVVLPPHSSFIGKTIKEIGFRSKYRLTVVALWREGKALQCDIVNQKLQVGDALLIQGTAQRIHHISRDHDMVLMEEDPDAVLIPGKSKIAIAITIATIGASIAGILPTSLITIIGAGLMLITGCLTMADGYRTMEWKAIFLIAGLWPLSNAITETGLAALVTQQILALGIHETPILVALILILIAMLFTQLLGGQVAALVIFPLALSFGQSTGIDVRTLAMGTALASSLAFITPYGHPVNLMVMGPGGYNTRTFFKVGAPLTLILITFILIGLKLFWNL